MSEIRYEETACDCNRFHCSTHGYRHKSGIVYEQRIVELEKALAEAQQAYHTAEEVSALMQSQRDVAVRERERAHLQTMEAQQAAIEIAKDRAEIKCQLGEAHHAREKAEFMLSFLPEPVKTLMEQAGENRTLRGLLRFAETMFVALRDGIDTEQMHCLPLDMTSSWRYVVDKALERITAALKEVGG